MYGVKKLTFLNFAGTSFILGDIVSDVYTDDEMKAWLRENLINGSIEVNVILTEPGSFADYDASEYKMYPNKVKQELGSQFSLKENETNQELKHYIIRGNFNTLCQFKLKNPMVNLNIYYTEIALPYGIMKSEFNKSNKDLNNIKVDIYAPLINEDAKRPSFILFEHIQEHKEMYDIFNSSLNNFICQGYVREFNGHPNVEFLFDRNKRIIHRAKINGELIPHSRKAVQQCLVRQFPIEIDLLTVNNVTFVWRDENCKHYKCINKDVYFSELDLEEVELIRNELKDNKDSYSQLMTLSEILVMLQDESRRLEIRPIPLLIEIKEGWVSNPKKFDEMRKRIIRICNLVEDYKGEYAIHTANPQVIKIIKEYNIKIPCGQISLNFNKGKYKNLNIDDEYKNIHEKKTYFDYVIPDFLSCNIDDYEAESMEQICIKYGIKKLGWTVKDEESQRKNAKIFDNLIVEF